MVTKFAGFGMAIILPLFLGGFGKFNPASARGEVNNGSCLQVLEVAIGQMRKYAQEHKHLPKAGTPVTAVVDTDGDSVAERFLSMVEYGGNESLTLESNQRTIILRCTGEVHGAHRTGERYCALLSGEIVLLPEGQAKLGAVAPLATRKPVAQDPQARVLRLIQSTNSSHWSVILNGVRERPVPAAEFTNVISKLSLSHNDLILLQGPKGKRVDLAPEIRDWLIRHLASNRIALYSGGLFGPTNETSTNLIPVYHWAVPFTDPRTLATASFFLDGRSLGTGKEGFHRMLAEIHRRGSQQAFILGNLYDMWASYGPFERPYEAEQSLLDKTLKQAGTEALLLEPDPTFY